MDIKKEEEMWLGIDSQQGRYMFGIDGEVMHGMVLPRQTVSIVQRSYVKFKAERLVVRRQCASDFLIRSVFIGCNRGSSPLDMNTPLITEPFAIDFDELPAIRMAMDQREEKDETPVVNPVVIKIDRKASEFIGAPFPLPMFQPGLDMTFQIENIGKEPSRFLAGLLGVGWVLR